MIGLYVYNYIVVWKFLFKLIHFVILHYENVFFFSFPWLVSNLESASAEIGSWLRRKHLVRFLCGLHSLHALQMPFAQFCMLKMKKCEHDSDGKEHRDLKR